MRNVRRVAQAAVSLAMWPAAIALSPMILIAGEPMRRYVMRHLRTSPPIAQVAVARTDSRSARLVTPVRLSLPFALLMVAISHPLWIALTAPGRWVADRFSRPPPPRQASN